MNNIAKRGVHIGFICHEYPPCNHGGIGSFTKDLAEGLVNAGFQVSVIGFYSKAVLDLRETVLACVSGVNIYRFPETKKFKRVQYNKLYNRWCLYNTIKNIHALNPFNLIESPEYQGWLPFGSPKNIPFITRFHGGESYFGIELNRASSRMSGILEKQQITNSTALLSVSDYTARKTLGLFNCSLPYTVIYNSVKVPIEFLKSNLQPVKKYRIVFAGSVIPKKGIWELVKAMNTIFAHYPESELYIAGKNSYILNGVSFKEIILNSLEKQSYKNRVKFLGAIDRERALFPLIASAEVCCYPSHTEAFGLAPLEAMAIGKAVVFTNTSAGPEVIEDGISGLLCDPTSPKDIAKKIRFYFDNTEKAKVIAQSAKKRTNEVFGYAQWIERNIEYFTDLEQ